MLRICYTNLYFVNSLPETFASVEDEVFDTTIEGYDESEDIDQDEYGSTSREISSDRYSMVLEVSPDEAVKSDKCIVFTDALMSLLTDLHGSICKRQGCGHALMYTKKYMHSYIPLSGGNVEMQFWSFWWKMVSPTNMLQCQGGQSGFGFNSVIIWEFFYENRVDVQILQFTVFF